MASRWWVGGGSSANWNATGNTNWGTASNTQDNASVPTTTDDVYFDGVGTGASNSTLSANITVRSVNFTGYGNTFTHNTSVTLTIGDGTAGASNVALTMVSGMTYTKGSTTTSAITFASTSGTQQTITTGTKVLGNTTIDGAGSSYILGDALTANGSSSTIFMVTRGTFDTGNYNMTVSSFSSSNGNARTITLGSSTITVSGAAWTMTTTTNLTFNANTSSIVISANTGTFNGGSKTFNDVSFTGSGTKNITGANSFANLTLTGTANKTDVFTLSGNQTITTLLTIAGNSINNRILIQSDSLGSTRTLTSASNAISNADFRAINGAGAASWNLSAITGKSGDAGGNTNITFTTSATQYYFSGTGSTSDASKFFLGSGGTGGAGRTPLPQDDVVYDASSFTAGSQTVTQDMPRMGKSIDFTGVTNTPTFTLSVSSTMYGSLTLVSGMTYTPTSALTLEGRSSFNLTTGGKTFGSTSMSMFGGTLTFQDAFTGNSAFFHNNGIFDNSAGNYSFTCLTFSSNSAATRTLTLGSATYTFSGTGNAWNVSTSALTYTANTATIVISNTTATGKTFNGAGYTYGTVTFSGDNITANGANTYGTLNINTAGLTNGVKFAISVTQTVTTAFTTNGSAGNLAKMVSTSAGTAFTLTTPIGQVSVDYMSIKDSTVTQTNTWYAGANSTDVSGNTNWIFTAPPAGGSTDIAFFGIIGQRRIPTYI